MGGGGGAWWAGEGWDRAPPACKSSVTTPVLPLPLCVPSTPAPQPFTTEVELVPELSPAIDSSVLVEEGSNEAVELVPELPPAIDSSVLVEEGSNEAVELGVSIGAWGGLKRGRKLKTILRPVGPMNLRQGG